MRILELSLQNFGVYRGRCTFTFGVGKPVVLIGGLNGRGKTTILEAVLVALYGASSTAYEESGFATFGTYLRAHTNTDGGDSQASIQLTFNHQHDGIDETLTIERSWDVQSKYIRPQIIVHRNGKIDIFLTENWASYVEDILPRALADFFFFDGEKIAELALDGSDLLIRESIRSLLGVTTVDVLRRDLQTLAKRVRSRGEGPTTEDIEIENLAKEVESLQEKLIQTDQEMKELTDNAATIEKRLDELRTKFLAMGGSAAAERARHEERRSQLEQQVKTLQFEQVQFSSGLAPLVMFEESLPSLLDDMRAEYDCRTISLVLKRLEMMASEYSSDSDSIKGFLDFAGERVSNNMPTVRYGASESAVTTLSTIIKSMPDLRAQYVSLKNQGEVITNQIDEEDNYLSLAVDETAIKELQLSIDNDTLQLAGVKSEIEALKESRSHVNGEYTKKRAEYKRRVASQLQAKNAQEEDARILRYTGIAEQIFEMFSMRLQERKVERLADTITACYSRLSNKTSLIARVAMDKKTLEMTYYNSDGENIDRQLLSAGERQLMVLATLWALAQCSDKNLPVMIDTPLARLDSKHRLAIVESYFPNAAEQSIILSTDAEIYGAYYDALKPNICDEYTLVYDDETRSTSIRRGYFTEGSS